MRLFAALPLSPEAAERLTRLRLRLSGPGDGLRWSAPEQWHITLQFYGECDEKQAACLTRGLTEMAPITAPQILLEGLGHFGSKGILYVTVAVTAGLQELYNEVARVSERCGFLQEARQFRPHVTLARSKGRAGMKTMRSLSTPDLPSFGAPIRWHAGEVLLVRSTLRPQGSEYAVISRRSLPVLEHPGGAAV